jgi:pantoate--beta-alanine ligase
VAKLFNIIGPDIAYFGRKDYQQAKVIERMAKDLNFPVKIKVIPTVRERDGLAMSSRNAYLSVGERNDAVVLSASIKLAEELVRGGEKDVKKIVNKMKRLILSRKSAKIEYLEIIDTETLRPVDKIGAKAMVAMAVYIGKTRLIDNAVVAA